jgi:hypothetical protein
MLTTWEGIREFMVRAQFDEEAIEKAKGAATFVELLERLDEHEEFCWMMRSLAADGWKPYYLECAKKMAARVRYLMSKDGQHLHDELSKAGMIRLDDPKFRERINSQSAEIFAEASEQSSKIAKKIIREFDAEAMDRHNLEFAKALADQAMQIECFLASSPKLHPIQAWLDLLMQSEIVDRIQRCMGQGEVGELELRAMAKRAFNRVAAELV